MSFIQGYVYFHLIGAIFFIAHLSFYIQYPGLSSYSSGLEPAARQIIQHQYPFLYNNILSDDWMDTDSLCDILSLLGSFGSFIIASGFTQNGIIFLLLSINYGILRNIGQVFYSFQWDILLIETGFATAFCLAPWLSNKIKSSTNEYQLIPHFNIGAWPLRFILFKLMLMSGVVKIQANCPTWQNLTALEFHFATQCLPGPLAWYAHQLHPLILRLSVAATLVIEIPMSFLLIAPSVSIRSFGAKLQILLQIMILLTGNYNFFNLLTIALCLLCLDFDVYEKQRPKTSKLQRLHYESKNIQLFFCCILLFWSSYKMFQIEYTSQHSEIVSLLDLNVKMIFSQNNCNNIVNFTVPISIMCTWLFLIFSIYYAVSTSKQTFHQISFIFRGLVCFLWIGILAIPLLSLTSKLQSKGFIGYESFVDIWRQTRHLDISNGYGLFRKMTGVGIDQTHYTMFQQNKSNNVNFGWAGLPPSIVARPEIIIEGLIVSKGELESDGIWHELNFKWKPGPINHYSRQVAPHQPRLDWQMWFAALGTYRHNPWFLHLVYRILEGCSPTLDLLDEPELLQGDKIVSKIRAKLFEYDFTRLDTIWNNKIPGAVILNANREKNLSEAYWTRHFKSNYLPEVSIESFGSGMNECTPFHLRCEQLQPYSIASVICKGTINFRENGIYFCTIFAFTMLLWKVHKHWKKKNERRLKKII